MLVRNNEVNCFNLVCLEPPPQYTNSAISSSSTAVAPYFATKAITYECNDGFRPNPSSAALMCTCMVNGNSDPPTASWDCNPATDSDPAPCQAGEYLHPVDV